MKKIILLLEFILSFSILAQIPLHDRYMLSPNAAGLGEFGEVPVSLYTGIPNISVPIYTIKYHDHEIPISLDYHSGGVHTDRHPGWVGLDWTLNCGGCISRIVYGLPDEAYYYRREDNHKALGYFYNSEPESDLEQEQYPEPVLTSLQNDVYYYYYKFDQEPDRFDFNFLGISGSFGMSKDGEFNIKCDRDIKVIFDKNINNNQFYFDGFPTPTMSANATTIYNNNISPTIFGFILIDENGVKYHFGFEFNAIEFSSSFFSQLNDPMIASTWHLSKIEYPDGATIELEYQKREYIVQLSMSQHRARYVSHSYQTSDIYMPPVNRWQDKIKGSLISPSYLKKINFGNYYVNFNIVESNELGYEFVPMIEKAYQGIENIALATMPYIESLNGNGQFSGGYTDIYTEQEIQHKIKWYKLTDISVINATTHNVLRKFNLLYNNDNATGTFASRLALTGLKDNDHNGQKYTFSYYPIEELPPYCQNFTDHWGFYNGTNTTEDIASSIYHTKKNTNTQFLYYGALNRIDYPTGGYTRFVYEPHKVSKRISDDRRSLLNFASDITVGGLRIKCIYKCPDKNPNNEFIYKKYIYTGTLSENNLSSGTLYHNPKYSLTDASIITTPGCIGYTMYLWNSQSVLPMSSNSFGSHIGYSKVIEVNADGSYSINHFTDYSDCQDSPGAYEYLNKSFYAPYSSKDYARGKLKLRMEYDSTGIKTRSTRYNYIADKNDFSGSIRCINKRVFVIDQLNNFVEKNTYDRFTISLLPGGVNDTIFKTNNLKSINKSKNKYTFRKLLRSTTKTLDNNITEIVTFKYADDFINSGPYNKMVDSHIVSPIIEKITEEGIYDWNNNIAINMDTTNMVRNRFKQENLLLPHYIDIATNEMVYENKISYQFNEFKKPILEVVNDSDSVVYVWGYNNMYPVALITNATIAEVENVIGNLDNFAASDIPDFQKLNSLRTILINASVTICEYIPMVGISAKIEPNGYKYTFHYDNLGRLISIKDINGKVLESYEYNYAN